MTRRALLVYAFYGLSVLLLGSAARAAARAGQRVAPAPAAHLEALPVAQMYDADTLDDAADRIVATDPFRLARHAAVGAQPGTSSTTAMAAAMPRLQLTVTGIIGGPPWRAVLNGIPGHEAGIVVATGDTVGDVRIRLIRRDSVVVRLRDSTWTLTLRQ